MNTEIICAVYKFLVENGHAKTAKCLKKESLIDSETLSKISSIKLSDIALRINIKSNCTNNSISSFSAPGNKRKITNESSDFVHELSKKNTVSHKNLQSRELRFNYKYILAPMVGASELPFRLLCRKYGAQLAYTPMMNSEKFAVDEMYRKTEFQTTAEDRPLVAHFSGNDPDIMLKAAKHIESQCDAIDLNLGCPQRVAYTGHFGSYLLDDVDRPNVLEIVRRLSTNLSIPIFVKIRLLDTVEDTIKLCFQLAASGASLIAIHARYRVNLVARSGPGARDGAAHLDQVATIKKSFLNSEEFRHIPIIANGNVICWDDVTCNLKATKADGVMSAEGLLDDPSLYFCAETNRKATNTSSPPSKLTLANEYLKLVDNYPATLKTVIFHIRRMCKLELAKYGCMEECIISTSIDEVKQIVDRMLLYEKQGDDSYILTQAKFKKAKDALDKKKHEENKRKEFEKRMMRKAKREGKILDYYLKIGAEIPSVQVLQELRMLPKEESFNVWKTKYSQHCYSYHIYNYSGMKKCDRDRSCAFLHADPVYNAETDSQVEVYG